MKLQSIIRAVESKSEIKSLRREGFIPAVLYVKGKSGETIAVKANELQTHIRQIKPGHLPTTIFALVDDKGNERRAIIKEIQYAVTNYDVTHLDFEELIPDNKINIKIPIECTGSADCVGIKIGGVLRQVIRHMRVRCLPKDIPSSFQLDIRELGLKQSKRLKDIQIPEEVTPLTNLNEVAAVIVKR